MVKRVNSRDKRGSDVSDAVDSGNVPGVMAPETLRPNMDASDSTPRLGQSRDGDESGGQYDAKAEVRVPESLLDRYDEAAYALSEPGDRVTRSDLFREALFLFIDELEDADDDDGADEIVTRGFSSEEGDR